jgi:PmbA protein
MTDTHPDTILSRTADAVAAARRAGADAADAHFSSRGSTSISVRLGTLEDVGRSEDATLSLRVFVGQRSARVTTSDLSATAIADLASRAVAMAGAAPEDQWAGLAPEALLLKEPAPNLDLADEGAAGADRLRALALAAEDAARAVAGVTNSEGGSAAASDSLSAYVTSHGFAGTYRATGYTLSASVLAGTGEHMQRDYDWHSTRHFADLDSAEQIGRCAGERAVARLNPGTLPSGPMPVLFDPRVAGSLVGHLVAAMAGPMIARGTSFLLGHDNSMLFAPGTRISNDPHRLRGLKSRPFDAEGLPTVASDVVADGRLGSWMLDSASARKLGRQPTGHAARGGQVASANLTFHPGPHNRAALMADIRDGVLITELVGQGIDYVTGDYSRAASGFRIIDGQLAGPVAGFTIAGNLIAMFGDLRGADDLDMRGATHVPTLRTDQLTIAGD